MLCFSGGVEHLQVHNCHTARIVAAADVRPLPAEVPSGGRPRPGQRHDGHHRCCPPGCASGCRTPRDECRQPGAGWHRGGTPFHHGDANPPDRGLPGEPCAGVDRRRIAYGGVDSTAIPTSSCHGWVDVPFTAKSFHWDQYVILPAGLTRV